MELSFGHAREQEGQANGNKTFHLILLLAGPIAEQSKSSDLDCGRGDPGSNPGEGRNFFYFLSRW